MSISSIGFAPSVASTGGRSISRQANQDFDQLVASLKNGDLSGAQQAYSSFHQIQAGLGATSTTPASTATSATSTTNPVTSDWSALGQALQSGNLTAAQSALGQLQTDAQASFQQEMQNALSVYALMASSQGSSASSALAATSGQAAGSVQNDLTALNQALQTGDTASAQKLLAQLEQDLQSSGQASATQAEGHRHHHHHSGNSGLSAASANTAIPPASSTSVGSMATASSNGTGTVA